MYTIIHSHGALYYSLNTITQYTCIHVYNCTGTQLHMYTIIHAHTTTDDQPIDRQTDRRTEEGQNNKKNKYYFDC